MGSEQYIKKYRKSRMEEDDVRFEMLSWDLSGWKDESHKYLETG